VRLKIDIYNININFVFLGVKIGNALVVVVNTKIANNTVDVEAVISALDDSVNIKINVSIILGDLRICLSTLDVITTPILNLNVCYCDCSTSCDVCTSVIKPDGISVFSGNPQNTSPEIVIIAGVVTIGVVGGLTVYLGYLYGCSMVSRACKKIFCPTAETNKQMQATADKRRENALDKEEFKD